MADTSSLPDDFLSDSSVSVGSYHGSGYLDDDSYYTSASDNDNYSSEDYLDFGSEVSIITQDDHAHAYEDIPLMSLLPEIRLVVYKWTLLRSAPILPTELSPSRRVKIWTPDLIPEPARWERRRQPALLRTSRRVRAEALPIYYSVNVFYTAGTVILAGCLYPVLRYPSPAAADPLRSIRHLNMVVTIVERYHDEEFDVPIRIKIALGLEVSLLRSRRDIKVKVIEVRGEKLKTHSVFKARLNLAAVEDAHRDFVVNAIRPRLDAPSGGLYDGLNLLRAAATMPQQLKSTNPSLQWRHIMQSRVKISELVRRGEMIVVDPAGSAT